MTREESLAKLNREYTPVRWPCEGDRISLVELCAGEGYAQDVEGDCWERYPGEEFYCIYRGGGRGSPHSAKEVNTYGPFTFTRRRPT